MYYQKKPLPFDEEDCVYLDANCSSFPASSVIDNHL